MRIRWIYSRPTDGAGNWFDPDHFPLDEGEAKEYEIFVGGRKVRKLPGHIDTGNHVLLRTGRCEAGMLEIVPIKQVEKEVDEQES